MTITTPKRVTEYTSDEDEDAIETARVAYVTAIRENRTDAEILVLRQALKNVANEVSSSRAVQLDPHTAAVVARAPRVLFDVVTARAVVAELIASNRATLLASFALRGLVLDATTLEELAQELAKNSAQGLLQLEIKPEAHS
jgi:hypothetical protein